MPRRSSLVSHIHGLPRARRAASPQPAIDPELMQHYLQDVKTIRSLAEQLIESTDWSSTGEWAHKPEQITAALRNYINCEVEADMLTHWHPLEGCLFPQGTLQEVTPAAVDVFLAALIDPRPPFSLAWILEALRFSVLGDSLEPGRQADCQQRVNKGLWLLVAMTQTQSSPVRLAALEVIEVIHPALALLVEPSGPTL